MAGMRSYVHCRTKADDQSARIIPVSHLHVKLEAMTIIMASMASRRHSAAMAFQYSDGAKNSVRKRTPRPPAGHEAHVTQLAFCHICAEGGSI
jgi:hypothetical protein